MASRPSIPAAIKRAVQSEAGYRCAVPTCRDKGPFDFEHIDEWSKVKKHEEHNIILLCVGCHARVTRGEIAKDAIRTYKRNLAIICGRYSLYEMRLLETYAGKASIGKNGEPNFPLELALYITETDKIHFLGLLKDRLVEIHPLPNGGMSSFSQYLNPLIAAAQKEDAPFMRQLTGNDEEKAKERIKNLLSGIEGHPKYWIGPSAEGVEFAKKYFSGEEIQ